MGLHLVPWGLHVVAQGCIHFNRVYIVDNNSNDNKNYRHPCFLIGYWLHLAAWGLHAVAFDAIDVAFCFPGLH